MFLITPILTNNNLNDQGYNTLLKSIDGTIADITGVQYLDDIFGFMNYVDMDLFDTLCEYKQILLDRLLGCNCLNDENLIFITSRIQQLLDKFN